jgi:putative transposase
VRDEQLKKEIMRVWEDRKKGRRLYGARKVWLQLRREGIEVARCTVERLMRDLGIAGASARRKKPRTTIPGPAAERPSDLLERDFTAEAPGRRWVADITYVSTFRGFVYTAFVTDLFSRKIVGWQVSDTLRAELALDALEMAIWSSGDNISDRLVHHSDRGVQYQCHLVSKATSRRRISRTGSCRWPVWPGCFTGKLRPEYFLMTRG